MKQVLIFIAGSALGAFIFKKWQERQEGDIFEKIRHNVDDFMAQNHPDVPENERIAMADKLLAVSNKANFGGCGCGCGGGCKDAPPDMQNAVGPTGIMGSQEPLEAFDQVQETMGRF